MNSSISENYTPPLNLNPSKISHCIHGTRPPRGGRTWSHANPKLFCQQNYSHNDIQYKTANHCSSTYCGTHCNDMYYNMHIITRMWVNTWLSLDGFVQNKTGHMQNLWLQTRKKKKQRYTCACMCVLVCTILMLSYFSFLTCTCVCWITPYLE